MVANKLTGEKGILFTAEYVTRFEEMEQGILQNKELDIKYMRAQAMLINAKLRQAKFLNKHTKLGVESALLATGVNTLPLEERLYSATDIAKEAGVSANKVGRVANANNIKTDTYGIYVLDKAKKHTKQVESFKYNEAGKNRLLQLLSS